MLIQYVIQNAWDRIMKWQNIELYTGIYLVELPTFYGNYLQDEQCLFVAKFEAFLLEYFAYCITFKFCMETKLEN